MKFVSPGTIIHLPHILCGNRGNILHFKPHRNSTDAESGVMSTSTSGRLQGAHTREEEGVSLSSQQPSHFEEGVKVPTILTL